MAAAAGRAWAKANLFAALGCCCVCVREGVVIVVGDGEQLTQPLS
jgi:hypothetical protein